VCPSESRWAHIWTRHKRQLSAVPCKVLTSSTSSIIRTLCAEIFTETSVELSHLVYSGRAQQYILWLLHSARIPCGDCTEIKKLNLRNQRTYTKIFLSIRNPAITYLHREFITLDNFYSRRASRPVSILTMNPRCIISSGVWYLRLVRPSSMYFQI